MIKHATREAGFPNGRAPVSLCRPLGAFIGLTRKRFDVTSKREEVTCKACLKVMANPTIEFKRGF